MLSSTFEMLTALTVFSTVCLHGTTGFLAPNPGATDSIVHRRTPPGSASLASTQTSTSEGSTASLLNNPPGERCEAGGTLLDEEALLAQSDFPISPAELIKKARYVMKKDAGVLEPALWADDFEFCAPVVGPLTKKEFLDAAAGFDVYGAFPDFDNRYYNFNVDPLEPNRVWFFTRLVATNTGSLFGQEPTNVRAELPPQVFSLAFTPEGLVKELTVGYVVDRRQGNSGGLGGMFGAFHAVGRGLPFPEAQPWSKSWQFGLFDKVGALVTSLTGTKE